MPKTSMIHFRLEDKQKAFIEKRAENLERKPASIFRDFVAMMIRLEEHGALDGLEYLAEKSDKDVADILAAGINARVKELLDKEK